MKIPYVAVACHFSMAMRYILTYDQYRNYFSVIEMAKCKTYG